jgi:hypothetical protein
MLIVVEKFVQFFAWFSWKKLAQLLHDIFKSSLHSLNSLNSGGSLKDSHFQENLTTQAAVNILHGVGASNLPFI